MPNIRTCPDPSPPSTADVEAASLIVRDADGHRWQYRLVSSTLERRLWGSGYWGPVRGADFEQMTPAELRMAASAIERGRA